MTAIKGSQFVSKPAINIMITSPGSPSVSIRPRASTVFWRNIGSGGEGEVETYLMSIVRSLEVSWW